MKYFSLFLFFICVLSCKAQNTNIVPLYNSPIGYTENPYFKDIDNNFNPFDGEWLVVGDSFELRMKFRKEEQIRETPKAFSDVLIGEYEYIQNNQTLVNSLPKFNFELDELKEHSIWGGIITTLNLDFPECPECEPNTRFIRISIEDISRPGVYGELVMAHFIENGVEKIRMSVIDSKAIIKDEENYAGDTEISIPSGVYTLIKQ